MSIHTSSRALLLLSSVTLLASGCGQPAQQWPGTGQGGAPIANDAPMAMSAEQPASYARSPETVMGADPALVQRINRLETHVGSLDANMSGLESDVADLQTDMTRAKPQLAKIDSMERHFRQLSLELDRIDTTYGVAPTKAAKPVPLVPQKEQRAAPKPQPVEAKPLPPVSEKKAAPAPAKAASGPLKVQQVRVGEQAGGKTRIVLDTTSPAKISYDIDNGEKILLVEVPNAAWAAQQSQTLKNGGLVSSYKAQSDASGSRLIVQLKGPAQVVSTSRLDPTKDAGHRVFLDLAKK
jgi:hypothetical protein